MTLVNISSARTQKPRATQEHKRYEDGNVPPASAHDVHFLRASSTERSGGCGSHILSAPRGHAEIYSDAVWSSLSRSGRRCLSLLSPSHLCVHEARIKRANSVPQDMILFAKNFVFALSVPQPRRMTVNGVQPLFTLLLRTMSPQSIPQTSALADGSDLAFLLPVHCRSSGHASVVTVFAVCQAHEFLHRHLVVSMQIERRSLCGRVRRRRGRIGGGNSSHANH